MSEVATTNLPGINVTLDELLQLEDPHLLTLKPPKVKALDSGHHISRIRGRGIDFSEVRNYQAGDDIRQMEWRITARTGQPHVKLYHEERERPVFLIVDFNESMFFGTKVAFKSVIAAKFATLLGFAASKLGDKVGGILFSGDEIKEFRPKARRQGILPIVKTLSDFSFKPNQTKTRLMSDVLLQLRRVSKPGSLIFIISDFNHFDEDAKNMMQRLQKHCDIVGYHMIDPIEKNPPKPGSYAISDGTHEMRIDTSKDSFRKKYRQFYQSKLKRLTPLFQPGHFIEMSQAADLTLMAQQAFTLTHRGLAR